MDRLRVAAVESVALVPCCRCAAGEHHWDRVADQPLCPNCQEALAMGQSEPLVIKTEPHRCVVCARRGTVRFVTFPLSTSAVLELDVCGEHLRGLIGRRLGPHAFCQLQRQLRTVNLRADDIFLLHGEFYDNQGRALRPAAETE